MVHNFPFTTELVQNQINRFFLKSTDAAGLTSAVDSIHIIETSSNVTRPGKPIHFDADAPSPWDNDSNLEFSWSAPTQGIVSYYEVYVSRNRQNFSLEAITTQTNYTYYTPYGGEKDFFQIKVVVMLLMEVL